MSVMSEIFEQRPYTYRRVGRLSAYFFPSWIISFEDTPIREFNGPRIEVHETVALMNAAYCNGYSSGYLLGKSEKDES